MTLAYFLDIKGVKYRTHFFSLQLYTISPRASECHPHVMCIKSVNTVTQSGLLRLEEGWGGRAEVPISIRFK